MAAVEGHGQAVATTSSDKALMLPSGVDPAAAREHDRREATNSLMPVYRVTIMSWCFQFLLDLLWIPLAAYFSDKGLSLRMLGLVFAANLGVRIVPNVLATQAGVKTDLVCMGCGLLTFLVNVLFPDDIRAIFIMAAGGGMTFVRAHLSVHAKLAAGGSTENLTLCAKWSGAARNFGTVVAFVVPVMVYNQFGWSAVLSVAMAVMVLYLVIAAIQHAYCGDVGDIEELEKGLCDGLVEEATPAGTSVPWIDWVMAAAFCVTELQMNVQAAAVPTTLMRQFQVPVSVCGPIQALGQLVAMGFLVILSKGYAGIFQKRPLNLIIAFFGTFVGMAVLCWSTVMDGSKTAQAIFVLSLYFFYIFAYTAQVTMLECLTGVLDMQNAIVVIGISEMIGCACSLFGGYLGPVLLEVNPTAPFILQLVIALTTTLLVAFSLGHRAMSQLVVVCETQDQYLASVLSMKDESPSIRKSLQGLHHMRTRPESYIGVEQLFRKHSSHNFFATGDAGELQPGLADGEGEALKQALLAPPTPARAGHSRHPSQGTERGASCSFAIPPSPCRPPPAGSGGHYRAPSMGDGGSVERLSSRRSGGAVERLSSRRSGGAVERFSSWRSGGAVERLSSRRSCEVPIPDVVVSSFEGRQLKKTIACFDRAYIDIDTEDYVVDRLLVQQLVMNQASCEPSPA